MKAAAHRQRGATLVVGLIVLVTLTLFALSAFTSSSMNLKTAANTQLRSEAQTAAQQAIDRALSTTQFIDTPGNALPNPCGGNNTACPDVTGDGVADYTVRLTPAPTCKKAQPVRNETLDPESADDLACMTGQGQNLGVDGLDTASGNSLCTTSIWEITAEASSPVTGTRVTVTQGVGLRALKEKVAASCS